MLNDPDPSPIVRYLTRKRKKKERKIEIFSLSKGIEQMGCYSMTHNAQVNMMKDISSAKGILQLAN